MSGITRIALVFSALALCAGGLAVAYRPAEAGAAGVTHGSLLPGTEYAQVASLPREQVYGEFESIIRRHSTVKAHHGRIEFGSVKMEGANAVVQVLFFDAEKRMTAFFYVLAPTNHSWKVENVQRIWFVPRAHLLRGLRV